MANVEIFVDKDMYVAPLFLQLADRNRDNLFSYSCSPKLNKINGLCQHSTPRHLFNKSCSNRTIVDQQALKKIDSDFTKTRHSPFFCVKDKKGSCSWFKSWIRTFRLSLPSFCGASTNIFFSDLKRALVQRKRKPPTIWQTERDVF